MTNQTQDELEPLDDEADAPLGMRLGATRMLRSWRTLGIAIPFIVLFVILSITSGPFLHTTNLINILDQQAATLCIAAAGTLVLVAGGIDLSVGATYGLATVVAGEIAAHHSPVLAIAAGDPRRTRRRTGQRDHRHRLQDQRTDLHAGDVLRRRRHRPQGVRRQPHRPVGELRVLQVRERPVPHRAQRGMDDARRRRRPGTPAVANDLRPLHGRLGRERRGRPPRRRPGEPDSHHHVRAQRRRGGPGGRHRHLAPAQRPGGERRQRAVVHGPRGHRGRRHVDRRRRGLGLAHRHRRPLHRAHRKRL